MKRKKKDMESVASNIPAQKTAEKLNQSRFAVMKLYGWNSVSMGGINLSAPTDDRSPQHFIPVFNTREQAVLWAGGDEHVMEVCPKNS